MQRREKQNVLAHSLQLLGEVNMSVVVAAMAEKRMGQPSAAHQEIALVNAEEGAGETGGADGDRSTRLDTAWQAVDQIRVALGNFGLSMHCALA